jgi:hypothetical protein
MNTFQNKYDTLEKLIFDLGLRIKSIDLNSSNNDMIIYLNNNHKIRCNLTNLKGFNKVSEASFMNYQLVADGTGIHWPDLDEDLSLKGFLKDFLKQKIKDEQELVIA